MFNYMPKEKDFNTIIELFTGPLLFILLGMAIIALAIVIVFIIGKIKLFKKCGQEWWKAIIPFYGTYVFIVKITGLHWTFFLLAETMFFGFYSSLLIVVVYAMAFYNLANKCHQDNVVSAIFGGIVSGIVFVIYGFNSKIIYDPNVKVSKCSFFSNLIK